MPHAQNWKNTFNALYRGIYAGATIVAPLAVTGLAVAFGGYPRVLLLCAVFLCIAAFSLRRFPREAAAWKR